MNVGRRNAAIVLTGVLVLAVGCGDGTPGSPTLLVRSVTVVLVAAAGNYQGTAVAAFSDGSSREVTADAQWISSDASVATVSSSGQVAVVKAGAVEIRATYQSVTGSAALTVAPPPPPPPPPPTFTLSGSIRDALDGFDGDLKDSDVCCFLEIKHENGIKQHCWITGDTAGYSCSGVPAGSVQIVVEPHVGYAPQSRTVQVTSNTTADISLSPLPFRLRGEVSDPRTEARGPACPARIEILDGINAGQTAATTPTGPSFEFSEMIQPDTANIRFSAPGGYGTVVKTVRLRGTGLNGTGVTGAALPCPNCPLYYSIKCS
jgi:hypothetical protein